MIGVEKDSVKVVNEQNDVEMVKISDIQTKVMPKKG